MAWRYTLSDFFRLSLIDEHAGGWAQAFHSSITETVLRENLSNDLSHLKSVLLVSQKFPLSSMFSHQFFVQN